MQGLFLLLRPHISLRPYMACLSHLFARHFSQIESILCFKKFCWWEYQVHQSVGLEFSGQLSYVLLIWFIYSGILGYLIVQVVVMNVIHYVDTALQIEYMLSCLIHANDLCKTSHSNTWVCITFTIHGMLCTRSHKM